MVIGSIHVFLIRRLELVANFADHTLTVTTTEAA
jgi:hypothetical protein